jgi:hypothetical protein
MIRDEIKTYILTKLHYKYITTNEILSEWQTPKPENMELIKSLQKEIPSLIIDEPNNRFRLRTFINK